MAIYYDLFAVYIDDWMELLLIFLVVALNWEPKLQQLEQTLIFHAKQMAIELDIFPWILPILISLNRGVCIGQV